MANYHRAPDGSIMHGPNCILPDKHSPHGICVCDYVAPHPFTSKNPTLCPNDPTCHECGLLPSDPVHRDAHPTADAP